MAMAPPQVEEIDSAALLGALQALKKGDFSVRLPLNWIGMAGKVADTVNDLAEMNERMASELERLSRVVGKQVQNIAEVTTAVANGDLSKRSPWTSKENSSS